jgi:polar amino acid transport system substrate-binding protein
MQIWYCVSKLFEKEKIMKKSKLIFFGLVVFALVLSACGNGDTSTDDEVDTGEQTSDTDTQPDEGGLPDLGGREVTVVIENAYLPFNYVDLEDGVAKGWDYDVIDEICRLLNCTPVYVEAVWEGMIQGIADGQWDVAADGITITEERDEIVDFSEGYVSTEQRLLVRIDEDRINSIEDIVNNPDLILATQAGTTNFETATKYIDEALIRTYDTFPFVIAALIAGDIDAVIIDETAGLGYRGEFADELKLVGETMSSDVLGFAFPNGSDLVDPFNQALAAMKADGFLAEVNLLYFGPDFVFTYDDIGEGAYTEEE